MSCRTNCCKAFALVLLAVAVAVLGPTPAYGNNCLSDVDPTIAKHLGGSTCTANDVRVAEAVNPRAPDGTAIPTCFAGTNFSFIADFEVVTTATSRENIGFYMRTDGIVPTGATCDPLSPSTCDAAEFSGTCVDNIVSPLHDPGQASVVNCVQGGTGLQCLGSAGYTEDTPTKNGQPDNCGDTHSASSPQFITIAVNNIKCPPVGSTFLLPNCTTWWQPTDKFPACFSDPSTGWPFNPAATAGTTSKCNCSAVTIPITPISYSMTVTKTPTPSSKGEPGGDFSYDVGVTNTTTTTGSFGSEILDQVCDNKYGNIGTTGACSGGTGNGTACTTSGTCGGGTCVVPAKCPAPTNCPASLCTGSGSPFTWCTGAGAGTPGLGDTCATNISCTLPQIVTSNPPNGNNVDPFCTFTGNFSPGLEGSLTDRVTVSGFGNTGQATPPAVSNFADATVTVSEAPATAKVIKSLDSGHACAIVRYKVVVDNTSGASTDESESLSALNDPNGYGDITKLSTGTTPPLVVGTTCGVAVGSPGLGSLSGVTASATNGGALPKTIDVGGNYTCEFDGEFCGALGTAGSCTSGLEQVDQVTATLSDDNAVGTTTPEGHAVTVTSSTTLTVDVCFTATAN